MSASCCRGAGFRADVGLTWPLELAVNKLGHAMHDLDPHFDRFSRTPELAALAADLGFAQPRLLQSMYIFKQPGIGGEATCHCDHTFLWTEPQSVIGFWFAIEDATLENGCMWLAPGHHRTPARTRFRLTAPDADSTTTDVLSPEPWPTDLVPMPVERGTLIALHGTLPHWSAPNTLTFSLIAFWWSLHRCPRTPRRWCPRPPLSATLCTEPILRDGRLTGRSSWKPLNGSSFRRCAMSRIRFRKKQCDELFLVSRNATAGS